MAPQVQENQIKSYNGFETRLSWDARLLKNKRKLKQSRIKKGEIARTGIRKSKRETLGALGFLRGLGNLLKKEEI